MTYEKGLIIGQPVVRAIWPNTNSSKDQISVQFMQEIEGSVSGNPLIAMTQGISRRKISTIMSFSREIAERHFGPISQKTVFVGQETKTAAEIFGQEANIQVTETTDATIYNAQGQPVGQLSEDRAKVNPQSGEVLTVGGNPIFVKSEMVVGSPSHTFLTHDATSAARPATSASVVDAGAVTA